MKILHLTLKKKWFDLIASGKKVYEYREYKPYWQARLLRENGSARHFDIIRFRNGYHKKAPVMDVECLGMTFCEEGWLEPGWYHPEHGEEINGPQIVLFLGKVLSVTR